MREATAIVSLLAIAALLFAPRAQANPGKDNDDYSSYCHGAGGAGTCSASAAAATANATGNSGDAAGSYSSPLPEGPDDGVSTMETTVKAGAASATSSSEQGAPNIVLIVLDDVGWANVKGYNGVEGDQFPRTPAIDALAATGVRLKGLYVQPMCSPTRAAILTGRYPFRYGAQSFVQRPFQSTWLPDTETTLADKLQAVGYRTHIVGKVSRSLRHDCL